MYLFIYLFIYLFQFLTAFLIYLFIYLFTYLFIYLVRYLFSVNESNKYARNRNCQYKNKELKTKNKLKLSKQSLLHYILHFVRLLVLLQLFEKIIYKLLW